MWMRVGWGQVPSADSEEVISWNSEILDSICLAFCLSWYGRVYGLDLRGSTDAVMSDHLQRSLENGSYCISTASVLGANEYNLGNGLARSRGWINDCCHIDMWCSLYNLIGYDWLAMLEFRKNFPFRKSSFVDATMCQQRRLLFWTNATCSSFQSKGMFDKCSHNVWTMNNIFFQAWKVLKV